MFLVFLFKESLDSLSFSSNQSSCLRDTSSRESCGLCFEVFEGGFEGVLVGNLKPHSENALTSDKR